MDEPTTRQRFAPKQNEYGEWDVYDTLHNHPYMTAENEEDAVKFAAVCNEGEPLIADGYLKPTTGQLDPATTQHYRTVVADMIAKAAPDKYDLARVLADRIEYSSDRMCLEHIYLIQLLWDEVQRQNGYEPITPFAKER